MNARAVILAICALPLAASAQPRVPWQPPCAVTADVTVNTYVGPIVIADLCLTVASYTGGHLQLTAVDLSDGIFKDGFDGVTP